MREAHLRSMAGQPSTTAGEATTATKPSGQTCVACGGAEDADVAVRVAAAEAGLLSYILVLDAGIDAVEVGGLERMLLVEVLKRVRDVVRRIPDCGRHPSIECRVPMLG